MVGGVWKCLEVEIDRYRENDFFLKRKFDYENDKM